MDWREYQEQAREFFSSLQMEAETDVSVEGVRGSHNVDVLVGFTAFGIDHMWVVECKFWKRAVEKEKVLALQSIVADVGAHRGFLLSESGFQSGAITAARTSNITLTNLEDLRENAEADIRGIRWDDLYRRVVTVRQKIDKLSVVTRRDSHGGTSMLKPGVSSEELYPHFGRLSMFERGLERARMGQFPIAYGPDESGQGFAVAADLSTFLDRADEGLSEIEAWTEIQVAKPWPNRPEPASRPRTSDQSDEADKGATPTASE